MQPKSGVFGSVIIRKQYNVICGKLKPLDKFDILHTKDFNPNSKRLVLFMGGVNKEHLATYLISLFKYYYELQSEKKLAEENAINQQTEIEKMVYQCSHYLTIYDEETGEMENNIVPGTLFSELPQNYSCTLCEAGKDGFKKMNDAALGLQTIQ